MLVALTYWRYTVANKIQRGSQQVDRNITTNAVCGILAVSAGRVNRKVFAKTSTNINFYGVNDQKNAKSSP